MSIPPPHPYRVTREHHGAPLTTTQKRVLSAIAQLCPANGSDCDARAVAELSGHRLGAVVVILQSLQVKQLVTKFADDDGHFWAPTLVGRSRAKAIAAAAAAAAAA